MKEKLTRTQLQSLKSQLIVEKTDLEKHFELNDRFGLSEAQSNYSGELSLYDNHPADVATETYERGKDIALNEHAKFQLEQIEQALQNIKIDHYGMCIVCRNSIPYERMEAIPTTQYCKQHAPVQQASQRKPAEEDFLSPPFGHTSLEEDADSTQFDGEDAWQIVESWGNSDSPAMAEDGEIFDYDNVYIEADESVGFVQPIESFLATDLYGKHITVIRNRQYRKYMSDNEGDHGLELAAETLS